MTVPTKAVIGWNNQTLKSGVTFTPTSEDTPDHDADNLGKPHPAEFWRLTTLTGTPSVLIGTGSAADISPVYDLVAVLYATASPHHATHESLLTLNAVGWTPTNAALVDGSFFSVGDPDETGDLDPGISAGTHSFNTIYTKPNLVLQFAYQIDFTINASTGAHLRIRATGATSSEFARLVIDVSDGSFNSSLSSTFTIQTATSTQISGSRYRALLVFTTDSATVMNIYVESVSPSFVTSWTPTGSSDEEIQIGEPFVALGSDAVTSRAFSPQIGRASLWAISPGADAPIASEVESLTLAPNLQTWAASFGSVHSFKLYSTPRLSGGIRVSLWDPHNEDSQLDVSNIFLGPTWRPTHDVQFRQTGTIDRFGRRTWDLNLSMIPQLEFESEALAMAQKCGVGETDQTSAGGVDFAEDRIPVFIALDPANPTQENTMYGWLLAFSYTMVESEKDADSVYVGGRYDVQLRVRDVLATGRT